MKVLILRFSSIGDIVLTTPVVRLLKTQVRAQIHYATKSAYHSILASNPHIYKVWTLKESLFDLIGELRKENFDLIIDLHHNLRTFIIKNALNKKSVSFEKLNIQKWLLVQFKIDKLPRIHIVDRYLKTVESLGITDDGEGLDFFIEEKDQLPISYFPPTFQQGFIAFVIGGTYFTKKLPPDKMSELCKNIKHPIVLVGGKEDRKTGEKLSKENKEKIFNTCGELSLGQSAAVVKMAKAVISHDTGLMHIAAAFQKEIYCLWGNTIPAFGMYPYRTAFHSIQENNLSCRPCSKIGFSKCPKGHFKCMNDLDMPALAGQINRIG